MLSQSTQVEAATEVVRLVAPFDEGDAELLAIVAPDVPAAVARGPDFFEDFVLVLDAVRADRDADAVEREQRAFGVCGGDVEQHAAWLAWQRGQDLGHAQWQILEAARQKQQVEAIGELEVATKAQCVRGATLGCQCFASAGDSRHVADLPAKRWGK